MSLTISSMATNGSSFGSLFGTSATSGSGSLYSMLGDYNSIRTGSYSKLMKSYFEKVAGDGTKKTDSTSSATKKSTDLSPTNASLTAMNDARSLKDSVDDLSDAGLYKGKTDGEGPDMDALSSAVKSFVSDYNDMVESGSESETSGIRTNTSSMISRAKSNKSALSDVGISLKTDGTLSMDEDAFKKADVSKIKSLFGQSGGFASMVGVDADAVDYYAQAAVSTGSIYGTNGSYNYSPASTFSIYS